MGSKKKFLENFLWGASTSSHQIEGGLTNNWTNWEDIRASQLARNASENGIGQSTEKENYRSNSKYSCDSFNHYKDDIKVLKELGLNAYRFSIEWSRIEPEKGVFSFEGIQYYKDIVKELKKNNIEPVVTLWHWTLPLWLEQEGGVMAKNFKKYFLRMTKQVLENISEDVTYWITINEPEVFSMNSYLTGEWTPNRKNVFLFLKFYLSIFPSVHKGTYQLIKECNPNAKISFAKNNSYVEPYNRNILNIFVANIFRWFTNYLQIDLVKGYIDYIGLNFYFHNRVGILGLRNDNDRVSDLGWWFKPESIQFVIKELWNRYKLPILVTENGIATNEDSERVEWLELTVKAIRECIDDNVRVVGYLYWSLLDNFEWAYGFWPRFGLVSVDSDSKRRCIKESGRYYSKIVKESDII